MIEYQIDNLMVHGNLSGEGSACGAFVFVVGRAHCIPNVTAMRSCEMEESVADTQQRPGRRSHIERPDSSLRPGR